MEDAKMQKVKHFVSSLTQLATGTLSVADVFALEFPHDCKDAIREAGGVAPLVALLGAGADAATIGAGLIWNVCFGNDANRAAFCEAGAVPRLAALLRPGVASEAAIAAAAGALQNLTFHNNANREALREAGGVASLVALLAAGPHAMVARPVSGALRNISGCLACRDAIRESGGFAPLVALLAAGAGSDAADNAAAALAKFPARDAAAIVDCVSGMHPPPLAAFPKLHARLRAHAAICLDRAVAEESDAALRAAIGVAQACGVAKEALARGRERVGEIAAEAAIRARRAALGVADVPYPAEYLCPITRDKMKDPVVASDGHTYERTAIARLLEGGDVRSPITREVLQPLLVPNRALRTRIQSHDADEIRVAEAAAARARVDVAGRFGCQL